MKKEKILRIFIICVFTILIVIKFYITFQKGIVESTLIKKSNSDLLLIGCFMSVCVLIFGTTIDYDKRRCRSIMIGLGILGIILHLILVLIAPLA